MVRGAGGCEHRRDRRGHESEVEGHRNTLNTPQKTPQPVVEGSLSWPSHPQKQPSSFPFTFTELALSLL